MTGSHFEISLREREDEQIRAYHDFDGPHDDGHSYMPGIDKHHVARLAKRPEAGGLHGSRDNTSELHAPGTGRSANRDTKEAA